MKANSKHFYVRSQFYHAAPLIQSIKFYLKNPLAIFPSIQFPIRDFQNVYKKIDIAPSVFA